MSVVSTSFLDDTSRQCCEGSPGRPPALCRCCELFVHSQSVLMAACDLCEIVLCMGTKMQTGKRLGDVPALRHLTASPKMLLFKGENSEVVLLVADGTWTQVGTFA